MTITFANQLNVDRALRALAEIKAMKEEVKTSDTDASDPGEVH